MKKNIPWQLIISHLKNETNQQEETELKNWLENKENNSLFLELVAIWQEIQKEFDSYNPDIEYYWKQLEIRMNNKQDWKRKKSLSLNRLKIVVAAASIILIIFAGRLFFVAKHISTPVKSTQTYTSLNGKSQMILPDGSTIWLNKGSSLTYETSFLNNRIVTLEGEALFEVRKDEKHPFIVNTENVHIKVHGTRFNVQAYTKKNHIKVALLEGKVSVLANNEEIEMFPGEIVSFNKEDNRFFVEKDDVIFESFWASDTYTFTAKPLGHICKHLEKWYNVNICLDPEIAESHVYTFTITDEPLETILQIMSRINPIIYSFEENNEVIIKTSNLKN